MEIKIRTLTPLWTGGVATGRMDRIHETGIMGSLRWWYETIIRGLGGEACDPSQCGCSFNEKEYKQARDAGKSESECLCKAGLCDACQVFGATGWRRRFQLRVDGSAQPAWNPPLDGLNVRPPDRSRGWFLPPGYVGDIRLTLLGDEDTLNRVAALSLFLEKYGAIGAKPQLGYGCFQIVENRDMLLQKSAECSWPQGRAAKKGNLPDLRDMTFFRFRFNPSGKGWWSHVSGLEHLLSRNETARTLSKLAGMNMIPLAPALKNAWRYRSLEKLPDERDVFGTTHKDRIRSKIAVSWAYKNDDSWQVRGWVWLPGNVQEKTRETVNRRIRDKAVWMEILKIDNGGLKLTAGPDALIAVNKE